ncbi:MAG: Sec-independent protein translocase protein TatB [Rhodospirillaceae bacterium]
MFDISWTELLVIAVVALIAIGPKELPRVLYQAGKWLRRARMMAGEFQHHFSDMMHEAELDELRKQAQAARDLTGARSLSDLVDPDGSIRQSFDPIHSGAAGYAGSPSESEPAALAEPVPEPAAAALAAPADPTPVRQG